MLIDSSCDNITTADTELYTNSFYQHGLKFRSFYVRLPEGSHRNGTKSLRRLKDHSVTSGTKLGHFYKGRQNDLKL